ncbi:MAG: hypothetical protein Tsb009_03370 [Planctomycetaceae bacterium]
MKGRIILYSAYPANDQFATTLSLKLVDVSENIKLYRINQFLAFQKSNQLNERELSQIPK